MALPPISATTVGSFPRPHWLARVERGSTEFLLAGLSLEEAQDDATMLSLRDQEQAGLDLVTDGEQRRLSFINHILGAWDGIDLTRRRPKAIRRRDTKRPVPTIVDRIRRRRPAAVDDLRFAKAHTAKPVKSSVPGPMMVIDTTFDEVYHIAGPASWCSQAQVDIRYARKCMGRLQS